MSKKRTTICGFLLVAFALLGTLTVSRISHAPAPAIDKDFRLPLETATASRGGICQEDISYLFCPAIEDPDAYKGGFSSYKTLFYGRDGWIFRSDSDLKKNFSLPAETLKSLGELSAAFEYKGSRLIMLYIPTRGMMHGDRLLAEDKRKYDYAYPEVAWKSYWDTIAAIREKGMDVVGIRRPEAGTDFFYRRDHHWNAAGAKRAAEALAAYIKKLPEYADVEQVPFATGEGDRYAFYGVSKKIFRKLCNTIQPPEMVTRKHTERQGMASATELFDAAKVPEIVLMGTSNSTQEPAFANFEGFLKEALSSDVLNMSVSGGGLDTAVLQYLNSSYYSGRPAKIAIWEVPAYYEISTQTNFFREAIPAVYGDCGQEALAAAKDVPLTDKRALLLSRLAPRRIAGRDYYLSFSFSRPVSQPFIVEMRGLREVERYKFVHSRRAAAERTFFLELDDKKLSSLDKLVIDLPDRLANNTVTARVCKKPEHSRTVSLQGLSMEADPALR